MADSGRRGTAIGSVGVLCLAVYWAAMFFPQVAHILPESSCGKFVVLAARRLFGERAVDDRCSNTRFKVVVGWRGRKRHYSVGSLRPFRAGCCLASTQIKRQIGDLWLNVR